MGEKQLRIGQLSERDVDISLASALYSSKSFRAFLLHSAIGLTEDHGWFTVEISATTSLGETDLLFEVELASERIALLIEHKIDAPFQPTQAERYRERGETGIRDGRWKRFAICLCAPEGYLLGARSTNKWDVYISFKSLLDWINSFDVQNLGFVSEILAQAAAGRKSGRPKSEAATAFWNAYRQASTQMLPKISISRLPESVSDAAPWPSFGREQLPKGMFVEHKAEIERVDLTFNTMSVDGVRSLLNEPLPFDVSIQKVGKSAALRISVPRIDHLRPFDEQQEEVFKAFVAVERLLDLGFKIAATNTNVVNQLPRPG